MHAVLRAAAGRLHWIVFGLLAATYLFSEVRLLLRAGYDWFNGFLLVSFSLAVVATAALVVVVLEEERRDGAMKEAVRRLLRWVPRVVGILFVVLLVLFAGDVFDAGYTPAQAVMALLMHLIPALVMFGVVLLAWRWSWVGAALFAAWAVFWVVVFGRRVPTLEAYVITAGLPLLVAALFYLGWRYRGELDGDVRATGTA